MFWLLALGEEGVAALAHDCSEWVSRRSDRWRPLPRADTTAVDERCEGVSIVARARQDLGCDLCGVPHHRC